MNKKVYITEGQLAKLYGLSLLSESNDVLIANVIDYVKRFGSKGKLPSFVGSFRDYFTDVLSTAYEWASKKVDEVQRYGFAYFKWEFTVNVIRKLSLNKRGLIYVERSIDFDLSKNLDDLSFFSVGECWSWKKRNAHSYCSDISSLNRNRCNVVICGYVHPDSIDWLETVYLNSYDMKNETEIRMNTDAYVEVSYILVNGAKKSLGGSYLLNASVDKYNKNKTDW